MGVETEAKIRVDSHEPLRRRLREAGAVYRGSYLETNRLYDRPDRSLTSAGCGLRARSVERLDGERASDSLTYKGPRAPGELKVREEIEVAVGDAARAGDILLALGYREFLVFEKRRESWRLGGVHVELDELPLLGRFVEIEGPDAEAVGRARAAVGLDAAELVGETYVSMLAARVAPGERASFRLGG